MPRTISIPIKVVVKPKDKNADATLAALYSLFGGNNTGFASLVQDVIAKTLFVAYEERFKSATPIMTTMIRGDSERTHRDRRYDLRRIVNIRESLRKLEAELSKTNSSAEASRISQRIDELSEQLNYYSSRFSGLDLEKSDSNTRGRGTKFVGGEQLSVTDEGRGFNRSVGFHSRLGEVLDSFLEPSRQVGAKSLTISFGDTQRMDRIRTSPASKSPMNVFWRQLEFGTGIYAKSGGNSINVPRLSGPTKSEARDGSWYIGRRRNKETGEYYGGLHILGSRPGNWLRDRTGLGYTAEGLALHQELGRRLQQAFRGK